MGKSEGERKGTDERTAGLTTASRRRVCACVCVSSGGAAVVGARLTGNGR